MTPKSEACPNDTAEQLDELHRLGFTLLPALISAKQVQNVRNAVDSRQPLHWNYQGGLDHYQCAFNRDPFWLPYLNLPGAIELAEAALGEDCHVICSLPGAAIPVSSGYLHLGYLAMALPEPLWRTQHSSCRRRFARFSFIWTTSTKHCARSGDTGKSSRWTGATAWQESLVERAGQVAVYLFCDDRPFLLTDTY